MKSEIQVVWSLGCLMGYLRVRTWDIWYIRRYITWGIWYVWWCEIRLLDSTKLGISDRAYDGTNLVYLTEYLMVRTWDIWQNIWWCGLGVSTIFDGAKSECQMVRSLGHLMEYLSDGTSPEYCLEWNIWGYKTWSIWYVWWYKVGVSDGARLGISDGISDSKNLWYWLEYLKLGISEGT